MQWSLSRNVLSVWNYHLRSFIYLVQTRDIRLAENHKRNANKNITSSWHGGGIDSSTPTMDVYLSLDRVTSTKLRAPHVPYVLRRTNVTRDRSQLSVYISISCIIISLIFRRLHFYAHVHVKHCSLEAF